LFKERIRLTKAQARRVELENASREGTARDLAGQDAVVNAAIMHLFLRLRPVATWLYAELTQRAADDTDPRAVAGAVQNWIIAARAEIEAELRQPTERARQRGYPIGGYDDLQRLLGKRDGEPDESA
jgi:small ligand-binding sensory domain FIST